MRPKSDRIGILTLLALQGGRDSIKICEKAIHVAIKAEFVHKNDHWKRLHIVHQMRSEVFSPERVQFQFGSNRRKEIDESDIMSRVTAG